MKKFRNQLSKLTLTVLLSTLVSGQFAILGQTTTEADRAAARKEEAAIRKAEADAALVEAQIAEKNAAIRKTQLELLKSNSEITGNVVENGIAASKAIGCAAVDISNEVERVRRVNPSINSLILYGPRASELISEYSAVYGEINGLNGRYEPAVARLNSKLDSMESKPEAGALIRRLEELRVMKGNIELKLKNQPMGVLEINKANNLALLSQKDAIDKELGEKSNALAGMAIGNPITTGIGLALDILALFKTDTTINGTDMKPGSMDMTGYLFRLLTLRVDAGGNVVNRPNALSIISPEHLILSEANYDDSGLIESLEKLSDVYYNGTSAIDRVAKMRKAAVDRKKVELNFEKQEKEVTIATKHVESTLDALAADPTNIVLRAKYDRALNSKRNAQATLEATTKRIENEVAASLDAKIVGEKKAVERLNDQAKKIAERFNPAADSTPGPKKLIGDYLKGEVLSKMITDSGAVWLETSVTAGGANQRKQSSPIIDVFTRGPLFTYSGGAVVSYQLRKSDSSILTAGTVWAYSPYKRSRNITKFGCQGISNDGKPLRTYNL